MYISPNGRCSRKFYWLFGVLPFFVIGILAGTTTSVLRIDYNLGLAILLIITLWPMLAMQIKRWHDIGLSGWFSLLTFIPYLGIKGSEHLKYFNI